MTKMKSCWPWPSSWASLSTTSEGLKNPSASSSPLKSSRPSKRPSFETRCAFYEASFVRLLVSGALRFIHTYVLYATNNSRWSLSAKWPMCCPRPTSWTTSCPSSSGWPPGTGSQPVPLAAASSPRRTPGSQVSSFLLREWPALERNLTRPHPVFRWYCIMDR